MTKLESQIEDLEKAFNRLKEAAGLASTLINQDATIQRFEFTFELAWKIMQTITRENGIDVYGVKNIIREGAKLNLIDQPEIWFDFLKSRNLTVHTYKEEIASAVYKKAKKFIPFVDDLLERAREHIE